MHSELAAQVAKLDGQGAWQAWLRFAASFTRYSFNNTILIWSAKPDATLVAGYRAWQAKGRQVRRGEKAIRVLGPVTRRVEVLDAAGRPVRDHAGQPKFETRMVGVKPLPVFDVSQTEGEPLPTQPEATLLAGQAPPGLWDSLQAFVEAQGFSVSRGDCGGANGVTMFGSREVRVRDDIDDAQAAKSLCHEAAHVLLHSPETHEGQGVRCRGVIEVEAESVAYLVTASHQLDSSQYSFNYVTGWAHEAVGPDGPGVEDVIKATGQRVVRAADQILQATKPEPTVVDAALDDLAVTVETTVMRSRMVQLADEPANPTSGWERVESRPLDRAAHQRRALPTPPRTPAATVSW